MITAEGNLKLDYEQTRLSRYSHIKRDVKHSPEAFSAAYWAWVSHPYSRERLWNAYCDMRDSVPLGTNDKISQDRKHREWVC